MMNPSVRNGRAGLLLTETRWVLSLRWLAGATIFSLGLLTWIMQGHNAHWLLVAGVGVFVVCHNAALHVLLQLKPSFGRDYDQILNFDTLQICIDLACLVLLTGWTGGLSSPVLFAFVPHMLFACLLQPLRRAVVISIASVTGLALCLWLTGHWPQSQTETVTLLGWAGAMFLTVYLTHRVTSELYSREEARVEQLQKNEEMLARLIAHQNSLVQAEKMAAMGQMVAGIAHEITNPLASMDSVLQLMQRNPSVPRPGSVDTLRKQIQRIMHIMRQFTSFSHPGHGAEQQCGLSDTVKASIEMLMFNRAMKGVALDCRYQAGDAVAQIDPHSLQQVVTNIVMNALDAVAGVAGPRIAVTTSRRGDACVIEIADNGSGIAPENLGKVFDSFFTTKPVGKGTGLGLAICARLVREQGGKIEVSSTPGEGTVFTVTLVAAEMVKAAQHDVQVRPVVREVENV